MSILSKHVILCGFMGAGKSAIAKALGQEINNPALDLDDLTAQKAGREITEIFAREGEAAFRQYEQQALADALKNSPAIIALGGGTPCSFQNFMVIKNSGNVTIYLQTTVEKCLERIAGSDRPLLKQGNDRLRKLYTQRHPAYEALADITIATDNISIIQATEIIKQYLINHEICHE